MSGIGRERREASEKIQVFKAFFGAYFTVSCRCGEHVLHSDGNSSVSEHIVTTVRRSDTYYYI